MVKNLERFERKMGRIPQVLRRVAIKSLGDSADRIVATARGFVSKRSGKLAASIGWVWGDQIPDGAFSIGTVGTPSNSEFFITIYAGNKEAFYAVWEEFGTQAHSLAKNASVERGLRQGAAAQHPGTSPSPFFYPAYTLHRRSIRGNFAREANRALKKLGKTGA